MTSTANPSLVVGGNSIAITGTTPATIALSSTPNLGIPSAGNLTNCTGYQAANLTSLGAGVGTFLNNPSSSNLAAAITQGGTGTGKIVLDTNAVLTSPTL